VSPKQRNRHSQEAKSICWFLSRRAMKPSDQLLQASSPFIHNRPQAAADAGGRPLVSEKDSQRGAIGFRTLTRAHKIYDRNETGGGSRARERHHADSRSRRDPRGTPTALLSSHRSRPFTPFMQTHQKGPTLPAEMLPMFKPCLQSTRCRGSDCDARGASQKVAHLPMFHTAYCPKCGVPHAAIRKKGRRTPNSKGAKT
jgi:hypothetical protein